MPTAPDDNDDTTPWPLKTGKALCDAIKGKQTDYFETARKGGKLGLWVISYAALHGMDPDSMSTLQTQQLGFDGEESEFLRMCINIFRMYVQRQATSVLNQEPALKCVSQNTDAKSQISAKLGDNIVTSVFKRAVDGDRLRDMTIAAATFGASYMHMRWDPQAGDMMQVQEPIPGPGGQPLVDPNNGQPATRSVSRKSGAPKGRVAYPWTHIQETDEMDGDSWSVVRVADNRLNLAATYAPRPKPADPGGLLGTGIQPPPPEDTNADLRKRIMNAANDDEYDFADLFGFEGLSTENKDAVTTLHFYYPRSVVVPNGRYCIILGDDILHDGDCPVPEGVPVASMCPAKFVTTTFGYAPAWDIMGIQQALNQIVSDQLSNIATFGRQSVAMEKGTEITVDALATGNKGFFYPFGGKPPAAVLMNDIGTGPSVLQTYLHKMCDDITGQNAASRGDPESNVKSGTFGALLHTIASEYMSYMQASENNAIQRIASIGLDMVRLYGSTPFLVESVGIEDRAYVEEYTREDIAGFKGVVVEMVSPMMNNIAGRLDMHDRLKDYAPEDRAAAFALITTGRSDEYMRRDRNSALYIERENEMLITGQTIPVLDQQGQQVPECDVTGQPKLDAQGMMTPRMVPEVQVSDDPYKHCPKHQAAIDGLMAADKPDMVAVKRLQDHMGKHGLVYGNMHPFMASFLGIQPPPPQPGTNAFQLAIAIATGQMLIQQASMGAMSGQEPLAPATPKPQPGQAGSMRPKTSAANGGGAQPPQQQPGANDNASAAEPGGSGRDSSGTPLPKAANPPANATQQA